jgi:hypothetical protein
MVAACADSSTAPRRLHPGAGAIQASDPPPPPVSGSGDGFLSTSFGDAAINAASTTSSSSLPVCPDHGFALAFTYQYLLTNTLNNEMAHLDVSGATQGQIVIRDLGNGKSDTHGRVQDAEFIFDIQDGEGEINFPEFSYANISGVLTNIATGAKCQVVGGTLNGTLASEPPPPPE